MSMNDKVNTLADFYASKKEVLRDCRVPSPTEYAAVRFTQNAGAACHVASSQALIILTSTRGGGISAAPSHTPGYTN